MRWWWYLILVMKAFCRGFFVFFLIFGNYRCADAAGHLFNAFGSMIGNQPSQPLLPVNYGNGNNNFRPSTGFNNNFRGTGTTNNNNDNSQFNFINSFKEPDMESQIGSKLKLGLELTENEKIAAEKFPGLQTLLDRLKELNRQKELQKQKENEKNGLNNGGLPNNNNGGLPNNNNGGLPNINNNGGVNNGNGNANDINGNEEEVPGEGDNKWIRLKKKKFFFQAKPVRPENEIVVEPEVVYYLN